MNEMVVGTGEAKRKLKELGKYWPAAANDRVGQDLGDFLSARFRQEQITAVGFMKLAAAAFVDLQSGKDSLNNNQPINRPIVGFEPEVYGALISYIPDIADAVFPPEFAAEVRKIYDRALLFKNRNMK